MYKLKLYKHLRRLYCHLNSDLSSFAIDNEHKLQMIPFMDIEEIQIDS